MNGVALSLTLLDDLEAIVFVGLCSIGVAFAVAQDVQCRVLQNELTTNPARVQGQKENAGQFRNIASRFATNGRTCVGRKRTCCRSYC